MIDFVSYPIVRPLFIGAREEAAEYVKLNKLYAPPPFHRWWVLLKDLQIDVNSNHFKVIKAGFITDFASIPEWAKRLRPHLQNWAEYGVMAIAHDYDYWIQQIPKEQADFEFLEAMIYGSVDKRKAKDIYCAVKNFGDKAWRENAAAKDSGLTRFVNE